MLPVSHGQHPWDITVGQLDRLTSDELSDAAHQIDSALADIEEEVDDSTEEVEDSRNEGVDERGECADDAGKELVDRLEKVLEGRYKFGHLGCDVVCMFGLSRVPV